MQRCPTWMVTPFFVAHLFSAFGNTSVSYFFPNFNICFFSHSFAGSPRSLQPLNFERIPELHLWISSLFMHTSGSPGVMVLFLRGYLEMAAFHRYLGEGRLLASSVCRQRSPTQTMQPQMSRMPGVGIALFC